MSLAFLLVTRDAGPGVLRSCTHLAAATRPGDRVVLLDAGSSDDTVPRLRRFTAERGWGEGVEAETLFLSEPPGPGPADWTAAARARAGTGWTVALGAGDLLQAEAVAALRRLIGPDPATAPDLVIANRAHWLAGPHSVLPASDAGRWPDPPPPEGDAARAAALSLAPDPDRLLAPAPLPGPGDDGGDGGLAARWLAYEAAVAAAGRIAFLPAPLVLTPLPGPGETPPPEAVPHLLRARLTGDGGRTGDPPGPLLDRLGDAMARLDPAEFAPFLAAATDLLAALPRRRRRAICAHPGPAGAFLEALHRGGAAAALPHLAAAAAAEDRARIAALAAEVAGLRDDVDLALPGPDYLVRMHARLRDP